ncbi:MAG TPA: hypothetical protein VG713_18865 [Pirellulales bacterium]|nr:hypothetical protein [Pirellulales bacterium]
MPRPLLAQPLRSVLSASVEELHALPAVGTRKLQTLTVLLQRIASGPSVAPGGTLSAGLGDPGASFDAAALTEANWEAWRQLVRRHLPVDEPLGRFTDSLRQLPRSIWWTPLDWYCRLSLAEMRRLRSHGRKRVAAILRVFNGLRIRLQAESGVTTVWRSPRISAVEQWMAEIDEHSPAVGLETFEQRFVVPVVEQLAVDLGSRFARLVHAELRSRSGVVPITGQVTGPVGQESRARIFQVMQNAGTALALRWPDAAGRISTLRSYGGLTRSSPACRILDYLRAKILVASVDHRRAVRPCGTERTQRL